LLAPQRGLIANGAPTTLESSIPFGAASDPESDLGRIKNNMIPELSNSASPPAQPGGYLEALTTRSSCRLTQLRWHAPHKITLRLAQTAEDHLSPTRRTGGHRTAS
jgi:hypothetical protein